MPHRTCVHLPTVPFEMRDQFSTFSSIFISLFSTRIRLPPLDKQVNFLNQQAICIDVHMNLLLSQTPGGCSLQHLRLPPPPWQSLYPAKWQRTANIKTSRKKNPMIKSSFFNPTRSDRFSHNNDNNNDSNNNKLGGRGGGGGVKKRKRKKELLETQI